jgi:tetratricopeptide (TPR) repeat protein
VTIAPLEGLRDRYGLPLTVASAAAAERYVDGVDRLLSADVGGPEALQDAVAADPACAMAHAALALVRRGAGDLPQAKESVSRAVALVDHVTPRERQHVEVVAALIAGDTARALELILRHLETFPRDALLAHQAIMLMASGAVQGPGAREERLALYERLAPHYQDDWWFPSTYGFALNESGRHAEARPLVERALALRPRNGSAAHAYAHVLYETGDPAGGAAFLTRWLRESGYGPRAAYHLHNCWHLAVFELALGHHRRAREVYGQGVSPAAQRWSSPALIASGAASLLWWCHLYGHPLATLPWGPVRDYVARTSPQVIAFRVVWDAYAAVTYAGAGDVDALARVQRRLRQADPAAYPAARTILLPLAEAVGAFAAGDYRQTIQLLEPVAGDLTPIGGSREQRDAFEDTLIEAYLRAGRPDGAGAAEARLRARLARRPSARDSFWLARALAQRGRAAEAAAALRVAQAGWEAADPDSPECDALRHLQSALGA